MINQDQAEYWNGDAGRRWVEFSTLLDGMLFPFAEAIIKHADITSADDVLDIGCGAGALSIMAAKKAKSVLGVDISAPLINLALTRSDIRENTLFTQADAAKLVLEKKRDLVISRFGVMFFNDPVEAFASIKQQVKDNGRMIFACWQSPAKNMWARAPLEAAQPFLKRALTPLEPHTTGPFAFADTQYLTDVLIDAGWSTVTLKDWTGNIRLPGKTADEVADFMIEMGPLSKVLKEQDLDIVPVREALVKKLSSHAGSDGTVDMEASVWIVKASLE